MIYTITLNPTIDYIVGSDHFSAGNINVYRNEVYMPGGKGINVSLVLKTLGIASEALGFCAGFTGREILQYLLKNGIDTDFVTLSQGISRINIKVCAGEETEINGLGPDITANELTELLKKTDKILDGDTLVLAGSLPKSIPEDYYSQILERIKNKKIKTVVDATGQRLLSTLKYKPFLIKPNHIELGEIFGAKIDSVKMAEEYGRKLCSLGAENVIVSMGSEGAVLFNNNIDAIYVPAVKGQVISTCGAGDSMVAGFIYGYSLNDSLTEAINWGTAAGAATAFSKGTARGDKIREVYCKLISDSCAN